LAVSCGDFYYVGHDMSQFLVAKQQAGRQEVSKVVKYAYSDTLNILLLVVLSWYKWHSEFHKLLSYNLHFIS
jgi:hypothetical protein